MLITILILTGIAFGIGILIYVANAVIPNKVKGLEQADKISKILPGLNCGACGYASCFAYAQAITEPKALSCCGTGTEDDVLTKSPCAILLSDHESAKRMEEALGVKLDLSALGRRAVVHCTGDSRAIYDYSGIPTCKGAAQIGGGYKQCLYACLGLGDCIRVCPQNAISIDGEKHIAVIDREKCNGCGLCIPECPQNLIGLVPKETKVAYLCNYQSLRDIPGREKCDFGCIHCRKCFIACEEENIHAIEWDKEKACPGFCLEVSPESHNPLVREASGKYYSNEALEGTISYALQAGCQRLDVFFMIGLPKQTPKSVMDTIEYCNYLLNTFGKDKRLHPFISPLAPFLDPGSLAFENPQRYGYRLLFRTLEKHRQALVAPSWKYTLNYETEWMNRHQIAEVTYKAGLRLNRLKAKHGLIPNEVAQAIEHRIFTDVEMLHRIDRIIAEGGNPDQDEELSRLKRTLAELNMATMCHKKELELPTPFIKLKVIRALWSLLMKR